MKNEIDKNWINDHGLSNKNFNEDIFRSFSFGHLRDSEIEISKSKFVDCRISKGAFTIGEFTTFKDVLFQNFDPGGEFSIHPGAKFKNVKFSGGNPEQMIWVKDILGEYVYSGNQFEMDISEFEGQVIVTGVDISHIVTNPNKHLVICAELLNQDRFTLSRTNYFRSSASKVKKSGALKGVFSYLSEYLLDVEFVAQLEYFLERGLVEKR